MPMESLHRFIFLPPVAVWDLLVKLGECFWNWCYVCSEDEGNEQPGCFMLDRTSKRTSWGAETLTGFLPGGFKTG